MVGPASTTTKEGKMIGIAIIVVLTIVLIWGPIDGSVFDDIVENMFDKNDKEDIE